MKKIITCRKCNKGNNSRCFMSKRKLLERNSTLVSATRNVKLMPKRRNHRTAENSKFIIRTILQKKMVQVVQSGRESTEISNFHLPLHLLQFSIKRTQRKTAKHDG